jgi:Ca-activated chloride channel family protein
MKKIICLLLPAMLLWQACSHSQKNNTQTQNQTDEVVKTEFQEITLEHNPTQLGKKPDVTQNADPIVQESNDSRKNALPTSDQAPAGYNRISSSSELESGAHHQGNIRMQEDMGAYYKPNPKTKIIQAIDPEYPHPGYYPGSEQYGEYAEQVFMRSTEQPLSTFSIDVDNASYTNVRRMLQSGNLPPADAVRIEEMLNYFNYRYPSPTDIHPFSIQTDMAPCPWNTQRVLMRIAMKGKEIPFERLPPMNLVFLIDVSGSMNPENRLPLLKRSMYALTEKLRPQDQVSIVVYSGAAGLVLPCTPGTEKSKIREALEKLNAGGSTAGGQGLELAYKTASEHFMPKGINRVILASDGDFNVGRSTDEEMQKLIEEKRNGGVTLTVLGMGMGNLKDSKMEILADHGNGNYFYIDSYEEAIRVLVDRIDGTLHAIAGDVKLQLEFNPAHVKHYRLIGYDNRRLKNEDFNNDTKDAGDLGAGHTITAMYEIVPTGSTEEPEGSVDPLKYGKKAEVLPIEAMLNPEWVTVKLRYKRPGENKSQLLSKAYTYKGKGEMDGEFSFCAGVAAYGLLLKESPYRGQATWGMVKQLANKGLSYDPGGYRAEFIRLASMAESLAPRAIR